MKNWKTLLLTLTLIANSCFAAPQMLDKVVAIVNNGVVLQSDVDTLVQSIKLNARQNGQQLPDDDTLRHQVLERLIVDQVILQLGQRMGIQVSSQQIDQAINNIAHENHFTVVQLQANLQAQGLDYNDYRQHIAKEITISEVRNNAVRSRVHILPQEVDSLTRQLANQNSTDTELNISHILIPLPENPTSEQAATAQQRAYNVVKQAQQGVNFAKLAITWSADSQALKGGELGWARIGELPSTFASVLVNAKKGDIIGPERSAAGFHILRVNDMRDASQQISITEVHARHILLKTSPIINDNQAQQQLEQIATDIRSGKISFTDAAKKYSQDPGSANLGGDLGWANPNLFDPKFRDALMALSVNQFSSPVHSSFGWHLIEMLGTRTVDNTNAALKDRAYQLLFNRKFSEEAANWMQEQRNSAYVKFIGEQ